jgi:hypothetical protein
MPTPNPANRLEPLGYLYLEDGARQYVFIEKSGLKMESRRTLPKSDVDLEKAAQAYEYTVLDEMPVKAAASKADLSVAQTRRYVKKTGGFIAWVLAGKRPCSKCAHLSAVEDRCEKREKHCCEKYCFHEQPQSCWFDLRPEGEIPIDSPGHVILTWDVGERARYRKYGCADLDGIAADAMKLTTKKEYFKVWVPNEDPAEEKKRAAIPYEDAMSGARGAWVTSDLARQPESVVGEQEVEDNPEVLTVQAVADAYSASDAVLPSDRRGKPWAAQIREAWESLQGIREEEASEAGEEESDADAEVPERQEQVAEVYDGYKDDAAADWTAPLPWQREEDAFIRAIDAGRRAPRSKTVECLRILAEQQAARDEIAIGAARRSEDAKRYNRPATPEEIYFPNDQTTEKYEYWRQIRGPGWEERPATWEEVCGMDRGPNGELAKRTSTNWAIREWKKRTKTDVLLNEAERRPYKVIDLSDPKRPPETREGRMLEGSRYSALTLERADALNKSAILCRGGRGVPSSVEMNPRLERSEAFLGYQPTEVPDGNKTAKGLDGKPRLDCARIREPKTEELGLKTFSPLARSGMFWTPVVDINARLEAMCYHIAGHTGKFSHEPLFLRDAKTGKPFQSLFSYRSAEEQAIHPPMPLQAAQKLRHCVCQQPDRDAGNDYVSSWSRVRLFETGKFESYPMLGDPEKAARDPRHKKRMDEIVADSMVATRLRLDAGVLRQVRRGKIKGKELEECETIVGEARKKVLLRFPDWLETDWKYKETSGLPTFLSVVGDWQEGGWEIVEDKGTFLVMRSLGIKKIRKAENKNFDSSYSLERPQKGPYLDQCRFLTLDEHYEEKAQKILTRARPTRRADFRYAGNGRLWTPLFELWRPPRSDERANEGALAIRYEQRGAQPPISVNEAPSETWVIDEKKRSHACFIRPIRLGRDAFSVWADGFPRTGIAAKPAAPMFSGVQLWTLRPWVSWPDWEERVFIASNHFAGNYWFNQTGRREFNRLSGAARKLGMQYGRGFSRGGESDGALADQEWMTIYWSGLREDRTERLAILRKFGGVYRPEDLRREELLRKSIVPSVRLDLSGLRFVDKIEDSCSLVIRYVWRAVSQAEVEELLPEFFPLPETAPVYLRPRDQLAFWKSARLRKAA